MNATGPRQRRVKMTLHVYTVNGQGQVLEDRGTIRVTDHQRPIPIRDVYPPCQCPRHRTGQAATR
ncbi:hypothetical protein [Streptomyces prasinus]|uniref:hypothetical protein n=1 Tax=Streptomyces prasinus TaxID=67345 RepID=UPI000AF9FEF9|nr:hypothetical protein [Streptomyces prasinus]